jgi:hypothetical protein
MVQAAVTGALDFTRTDPKSRRWWQRLRWVLLTLHNKTKLEYYQAQHRHWVTEFANSSLDNGSFSATKAAADDYLNRITKLLLPWESDNLQQSGGAENLVNEFREMYGYPGDPRYEQMLQETLAAFKQLSEQ